MRHRIIMMHYQEVQEKQDYHEFFHTSLQGYHEVMINRWFSSGCLSVRFYPIKVKSAELIGPKLFCKPRVTPGKVYGWSNYQNCVSIKNLFLNILKFHDISFYKIRDFFSIYFVLNYIYKYFACSCLLDCLFVCPFISKNPQGRFMVHQNSIFSHL